MKSSSNGFDIDQLLRSYFRRETPKHWPLAPGVDEITVARPEASKGPNRILIGISVTALLAIYLGVAAFFPRETAAGLSPNGSLEVGKRPLPPKTTDQTP
jgi:hypothetical protein